MALSDTGTGQVILRELKRKYASDDPATLLEAIVLDHFNQIFTEEEQGRMTKRMNLAIKMILAEYA